MDIVRAYSRQIFASFAVRNYRRYFTGQSISHVGSWMHMVALGWLVLTLTGSGIELGSMLALRFTPILFGGIAAGIVVDRFDKRYLLIATQSVAALLALVMGVLVFTEHITMWMVYLVTFLYGVADTFDRPARQTFVHEMVGPEYLRNAVALNSTMANLARAIGPLIAGVLIAGVGIATCFFANALSFVVFVVVLTTLRESELHREVGERKVEHIFTGVRYVASVPLIWAILITMAIIGTLTYEFQTTLPLLARVTFLGDAADYAALLSAMGAGSVVGGLFVASRKEVAAGEFVLWALLFGAFVCVVALMPSLSLAVVAMTAVGFFSIAMSATGNTLIQLGSAPHMRGRVMALWSMAIFGSTVIGAPIVGFIGEHASPRAALLLGGAAALAAAIFAARRLLDYQFPSVPTFISIRREEAVVENRRA